jgi:hypothetical protein
MQSPSALSNDLLSEVCRWQPASVTQQDNITLIIIDIVSRPEMSVNPQTLRAPRQAI